jgi:NAD(P)-dependent dehydrogenase (short-subunit alcohol dehydrogenase family)
MAGIIVITGASRGIGAATARMAGARGYHVAVNYNASPDAAHAVVADITKAGGKAVAIAADVSTDAGATHLFAECDRQLGPVTALFNNAGIIHTNMTILGVTAAVLERQWRVNVTSQFLCAREAVKRMSTKSTDAGQGRAGKGGAIVNMSSRAAAIGGAHTSLPYAASKGAIDTFTHGLALEVAGQGIRVNAVRPGLIETTIHNDTGDMDRLKRLTPLVPQGRTGTPEEIAEAVLWLLSPAASYVTASLVDLGGGR